MAVTSDEILIRLCISLGLGFLIGLEREYAKRVVDKEEQFAGVRTYTFIALFGFLSAFLAERYGPPAFIVAMAGLMALVIVTYAMTAKSGSYGITTELSGILAFVIGAVVFQGEVLLSVIATVIITSLLSLKVKLHSFIATLTPQEIRAFIQFVIISVVVLPFLPNEPLGPNGVWILHDIWTMVILVTGISLTAYLLNKIIGSKKGTLVAGVVGGMISSTAVTLSLARSSREHISASHVIAAVSIIAATATLYPRILLETWVVNRDLALQLALPIALITLVGFGTAYIIHRKRGREAGVSVPIANPLNFGVALQFALIYMAVQWLMDLASTHYNAEGLYATSLVFGATDMDAITLSIARKPHIADTLQGMTAVLLATLSNTVMKFLIVVFLGDKSLRKWVGLGFGAIFLATVLGMAAMWLL